MISCYLAKQSQRFRLFILGKFRTLMIISEMRFQCLLGHGIFDVRITMESENIFSKHVAEVFLLGTH